MTRPARPNYLVQVFAPDANYPAGGNSWNGNPTKVDPPGRTSVGLSPGQGNAAQYHNWAHHEWSRTHQDVQASLQAMYDWINIDHVRNWNMAGQTAILGAQQVRFNAGVYFACGSDGSGLTTFCRTRDLQAWPTADEIGATPDLSTIDCNFDVAADSSVVVPGQGNTDGVSVVECTSAGVWTKRAAVFATAFNSPDCIYEPVSGTWVVAGHKSGTSLVQIYTSPDRTTWTSRVPPASIPAVAGNIGPNVRMAKDGLGKIVAQFFGSSIPGDPAAGGNSVSFSVSSDGGVTWSAIDTHVTAFVASPSAAVFHRPVWTGTHWVAIASNLNDKKTYVYNSTDGATWTQVALLTSVGFTQIACDGELVVAVDLTGALSTSIDAGATWLPAYAALGVGTAAGSPTPYKRLFGLGGGFLSIDTTANKIRASLVRGPGGATPIT